MNNCAINNDVLGRYRTLNLFYLNIRPVFIKKLSKETIEKYDHDISRVSNTLNNIPLTRNPQEYNRQIDINLHNAHNQLNKLEKELMASLFDCGLVYLDKKVQTVPELGEDL